MSGLGKISLIRVVVPVFLLFAVGFPIVVASCPMASEGEMSCRGCNPASAPSNGSASGATRLEPNSSCCETILTGVRVESHFLKTESAIATAFTPLEACGSLTVLPEPQASCFKAARTVPDWAPDDLTLLTSSLLI